mgnify:CR=1 FL=1
MNKNDIVEIRIDDLGNDGEGIGHLSQKDGRSFAIFVKDVLVGELIRVRLLKIKKNYAYGRLEEIIEPSMGRVEPMCPDARRCGGCSLMHMSYAMELEYKWNKVKSCLERIGEISNPGNYMEKIRGMDNPYYFRNKMQFPVGVDNGGNVVMGFFAQRTHSIINLDKCCIGHPVNEYLVKYIKAWLQKYQDRTGGFVYDEEIHKGLVRHVLTRVGFKTGEVMVCLVINGSSLGDFPGNISREADIIDDLISSLQEGIRDYNDHFMEYPLKDRVQLTGVSININRDKTNKILGNKCKTLWGSDSISDYIGDIRFNISPMSFFQVNPVQTKVLYDMVIEYAELSGNENVWDMYCGIGTITLSIAKKAKKVYGVEIVPQAIEDAKCNAALNQISNVEFFCGKAEEVVPEFFAKRNEDQGSHPDVVVVDPPRKGCDQVLLHTISSMKPEKLVYVSCDPATLARDLKYLLGNGFMLKKVGVVDQFCHSGHVESVTLLQKIMK